MEQTRHAAHSGNLRGYAEEAAQSSHAGLNTCTATNSGGSATSAEIPVGVHLKPLVIVEQPSYVSINEGQAYSFTVRLFSVYAAHACTAA